MEGSSFVSVSDDVYYLNLMTAERLDCLRYQILPAEQRIDYLELGQDSVGSFLRLSDAEKKKFDQLSGREQEAYFKFTNAEMADYRTFIKQGLGFLNQHSGEIKFSVSTFCMALDDGAQKLMETTFANASSFNGKIHRCVLSKLAEFANVKYQVVKRLPDGKPTRRKCYTACPSDKPTILRASEIESEKSKQLMFCAGTNFRAPYYYEMTRIQTGPVFIFSEDRSTDNEFSRTVAAKGAFNEIARVMNTHLKTSERPPQEITFLIDGDKALPLDAGAKEVHEIVSTQFPDFSRRPLPPNVVKKFSFSAQGYDLNQETFPDNPQGMLFKLILRDKPQIV